MISLLAAVVLAQVGAEGASCLTSGCGCTPLPPAPLSLLREARGVNRSEPLAEEARVQSVGQASPRIISRAEWGAKPIQNPPAKHRITKITLHHTGVRQNPNRTLEDKLRGLQAFSQREDKLASGKTKPAWPDIPYHYYIDIEGRIGEGREIAYPGDTNTSYSTVGHALVVVDGSFPADYFNIRQRRALYQVVLWLAEKHKVPSAEIKGHLDYTPGETDCPGKSIIDELPKIRAEVKAKLGR